MLFVYGTLMRGQRAALTGAAFLGEAVVEGFGLYHLGGYPAIAPADGRVHGELYEVPDAMWPALDRYEGVPALYRRVEVALVGGGTAQAYVMSPEQVAGKPRIANGDWRSA